VPLGAKAQGFVVRLSIEKLVPGGQGFARLEDGRPVFVSGAFPGDVVEVDRLTEKKQYAHAETFRLSTASPERREPSCPVFHTCGGCDWMPLPEATQRDHKLRLVREALARTGRFHEPDFPIEFCSVGPTLGYRSRVRLHFDAAGSMGYFARGSHEIESALDCQVVSHELANAILALDRIRSEDPTRFAVFTEVEVRAFSEGRSLSFAMRRGKGPPEALLARLGRDFLVGVVPGRSKTKPVERWPSVNGVRLFAAPGAFTQVNWPVNLAIVEELLEGVARRGVTRFLDLYCGIGNFALPLLAAGLEGRALDDDRIAIESARQAARAMGVLPESFERADVGKWLSENSSETFDLVVIDPPRTGIAADPRALARWASRCVFLCSCDPVTFARDLRRLVDEGLEVETVTAYDMFPQTHHVELVCWLSR
jgi:23S rRNA (uracil1939-C5)-methyltransferase